MTGSGPGGLELDGHYRIDDDNWRDVWVVGDVHGCRTELERLVERIDPDDRTLLVLVGDLVRKGPDSHGVVEYVRRRENLVSVRGNNEAKILRGDADLTALTTTDRAYIETMPHAISWADELVVHGGVDPRTSLADHGPEDLRTMRSLTPSNGYERPFWFERYTGSPRVFFGHTVLSRPFESKSAIGLDTGCVYGGELTAFHCDSGEFVAVEAEETYQSRSEDAVVTPRMCGYR